MNAAPEIAKRLQGFLVERFPDLADSTSTMRQTLAQVAATIQSKGAELANTLVSSLLGVISAVVFIVVVPVVAFYLLLDWDQMLARIDSMLPRDHAPVIRQLAREVDAVLAGFVRGQITVCLLLGTFYSVALMVAGLQFGLMVGRDCRDDHLYPLCRLAGGRRAGHRAGLVPVLGRLGVDRRDRRDLRRRASSSRAIS